MAGDRWSEWAGRPRPPQPRETDDAADPTPATASRAEGDERPGPDRPSHDPAYESDWYASLRALAGLSEDADEVDDTYERRADEALERSADEARSADEESHGDAAGVQTSAATELGEADAAPPPHATVAPQRPASAAGWLAESTRPPFEALTFAEDPLPSLDAIDPELRRRALAEISSRGLSASEVQRVLDMTLDPDEEVRRHALVALRSDADLLPDGPIHRALQDPVDRVRAEAVRVAAGRGDRDLGALLPLLGNRAAPATQAAALELVPGLVAHSDPMDDDRLATTLRAIAGLESRPNETERAPLAELGRAIGAKRLLRMLEIADDRRLGAVRLLALEGSTAALRGLAALRNDPIEEVRMTADRAIERSREMERMPSPSPATEGSGSTQVERAAESEMLTALARALDDPDDGVRGRARAALIDVDRRVIVRWVRESLRCEDDEVAAAAASVARLLGVSEVASDLLSRGASAQEERRESYRRVLSSLPLDTEALVGALANVDPERRPGAAQLVWLVAGRPALPLLQQGIFDANPSVRVAVLHVLGDSGDAGALATAERILGSDQSPDVRIASVAALRRAPADTRMRCLEAALDDPEPTVRAAAIEGLATGVARDTLDALARALRDLDARVWRAALPHVASLGEEEVAFVWKALTSARAEQRRELIDAIAEADPGKVAGLTLSHAGSLDPAERELAIRLAGRGGTDACVQACVTSLQDPVVPVRQAAAMSLAQLKSPAAVSALGASLQDPAPAVRVVVLRALGVIDSEAVLGFLVRALQDPHPDVRTAASAVLTEWSSPAVARRLAGILATPALRDQATELLMRMGPSAAELLVDVLLRSTAAMAPAVGRLLETIVGIEAFAGRLDSADPQQRRRAMIAIAAIGGERAVRLAEGMLLDPDQHLRTAALEALVDLGDPSTIEVVTHVAEHDPVYEVAETARWVLGKLRPREADATIDRAG